MYAFLGISLATQDYINPSIDIIKKKGVVSTTKRAFDNTILLTLFVKMFSFPPSRWMRRCWPWPTQQLSHSSSWIRSSLEYQTLESLQSCNRLPSTRSSFKVSSIKHKQACFSYHVCLLFRRFLSDRASKNPDRLVDHHSWNGFHLHLPDCHISVLVRKQCPAVESSHSSRTVYCAHLPDEIQQQVWGSHQTSTRQQAWNQDTIKDRQRRHHSFPHESEEWGNFNRDAKQGALYSTRRLHRLQGQSHSQEAQTL